MGAVGGAMGAVQMIGNMATTYSAIKGVEATQKGMEQQSKMMKEQQKMQASELKKAQEESLKKRKSSIDLQRQQLLGAGDTAYGINQTSEAGADMGSGTLTGSILG